MFVGRRPKFTYASLFWWENVVTSSKQRGHLESQREIFYMISPSHYLEGDIKNISLSVTNEIVPLAVGV